MKNKAALSPSLDGSTAPSQSQRSDFCPSPTCPWGQVGQLCPLSRLGGWDPWGALAYSEPLSSPLWLLTCVLCPVRRLPFSGPVIGTWAAVTMVRRLPRVRLSLWRCGQYAPGLPAPLGPPNPKRAPWPRGALWGGSRAPAPAGQPQVGVKGGSGRATGQDVHPETRRRCEWACSS